MDKYGYDIPADTERQRLEIYLRWNLINPLINIRCISDKTVYDDDGTQSKIQPN